MDVLKINDDDDDDDVNTPGVINDKVWMGQANSNLRFILHLFEWF